MFKISAILLLPFLFSASPANRNANSKPPATTTSPARNPEIEALRKEVIKDILSPAVNEEELLQIAAKLKPDGSWADINYADKTRGSWPVILHLTRLNDLAVMHARETGNSYNNPALREKILRALDFWFKNDFICPNWWYPQIGVPKVLGPTMILMQNFLTRKQITDGVNILARAKIGMTGQNKVWLSGNVIYRSLITNELPQIEAAVAAIQNEIIVSEGEGIQPDNSFHQHGPQQQFGNYGLSFAADMLKWGNIFQPTPFHFSTEKITMLRNYLLHGMKWVIWNDKMDISACGRQLFPDAQSGKAKYIATTFSKMKNVDAENASAYQTALEPFDGNIHFWRSDMTIHRRKNFYVSVKMSSNRVAGAESCNEENVSGYHLGDGATYFYQSNEEYTDIFPYWDWKMIPGTTTFHDEVPLPMLPCNGYRIASDFVGGVSNEMNGIASLTYRRDSLTAQKSWFFFNDAIICLGAGITSARGKPVYTTVNQSFLNGSIISEGKTYGEEKTSHSLLKTSWIIHDKWGYYFPAKADVFMSNKTEDGDWHNVLRRMPSITTQAPLFKLWFDHGSAPASAQYAYYVFAKANPETIQNRGKQIAVIANTAALQAAEIASEKMAGFVFVKQGKAQAKTSGAISVNQPCIVMFNSQNITVSDPTHKIQQVSLMLQGRKQSATVPGNYAKQTNTTTFQISLPQGAEAGKSVNFSLD